MQENLPCADHVSVICWAIVAYESALICILADGMRLTMQHPRIDVGSGFQFANKFFTLKNFCLQFFCLHDGLHEALRPRQFRILGFEQEILAVKLVPDVQESLRKRVGQEFSRQLFATFGVHAMRFVGFR